MLKTLVAPLQTPFKLRVTCDRGPLLPERKHRTEGGAEANKEEIAGAPMSTRRFRIVSRRLSKVARGEDAQLPSGRLGLAPAI